MTHERRLGRFAMVVAGLALAAGCGGGATPVPTPSPSPSATPVVASEPPSAEPSSEPSPSVSPKPVADPVLDAPDTVVAGASFEVAWSGTPGQGDYVTMVVMGVNQRTNEPAIPTTSPSPWKLVAPSVPGEYEVWYVRGASDLVSARRPITVTAK